MSNTLKRDIVIGFLWSFFGQTGYFLVTLIANIIVARIIGPDAFGQIGIVMFFIFIAQVLTESGLGAALVRKTKIKEEDFSTVFIFNLAISIILCLIIFFVAGHIADYYSDVSLKKLISIASLVLIINAFQIVNSAKLIHSLNYKKKSIIDFIAISIASVVGIIMATVFNAGVWAVVSIQLIRSLLITIQLFIYVGFLKTLVFNKESFKALYKFGINTTLASLLNTAFDNIYQLILGKYFAITQTGLFYQAKNLQQVPVGILNSITQGIIYASLSKVQNDLYQFKTLYNRIMTLFTIAVGFICLFIFFYAENIIMILYGQEWLGAVFYMQVLIIASFFYMQEMFNRIIFKIFDRTDKILYLEIIKKIFQASTILIGIIVKRIDVLLYGFLLISVLSYFINYFHSRKILGSFSWSEILITFKIILIIVFIFTIGLFMKEVLNLTGYLSFWLFPFFIILNVLLIKVMKICEILKDIILLKEVLSNRV